MATGGLATPLFLNGRAGRLFCVNYPAAEGSGGRGGVICVPAFAEEMNRSRRMVSLQARALARLGFDVLVLDLYGTGDSDGDFRDARWSLWLDDVAAAANWLSERGNSRLTLWGVRLGSLLAVDAAARQPGRFGGLLLWQPVVDGKATLTQFLRIRVATAMAEGRAGETTEALRNELAAGRSIEIGGYELAPELADAIGSARIDGFHLAPCTIAHWLEVSEQAGDLSPAGRRIAAVWRSAEISLSAAAVAGPPFWALQEVTLAPDLLAATCRAMEASSA